MAFTLESRIVIFAPPGISTSTAGDGDEIPGRGSSRTKVCPVVALRGAARRRFFGESSLHPFRASKLSRRAEEIA